MAKKRAEIPVSDCVACGRCVKECPKHAISVYKGMYAAVNEDCIGCGKCVKVCPAGIISLVDRKEK